MATLSRRRRTGGDQPNAVAAPRVDNDDHSSGRIHTQRNVSHLVPTLNIFYGDRVLVLERRHGVGEVDTVLLQVRRGFPAVPFDGRACPPPLYAHVCTATTAPVTEALTVSLADHGRGSPDRLAGSEVSKEGAAPFARRSPSLE